MDSIFGLPVHEYVYCDVCNQTTQESRYVQYFFNTSAAGMRSARQLRRSASVGQLLRSTESQDRKSCDTDKGEVASSGAAALLLPKFFKL